MNVSAGPIYDRCKHLLPKEVDGGEVAGLNARWRLYKYGPEDIFRQAACHLFNPAHKLFGIPGMD